MCGGLLNWRDEKDLCESWSPTRKEPEKEGLKALPVGRLQGLPMGRHIIAPSGYLVSQD